MQQPSGGSLLKGRSSAVLQRLCSRSEMLIWVSREDAKRRICWGVIWKGSGISETKYTLKECGVLWDDRRPPSAAGGSDPAAVSETKQEAFSDGSGSVWKGLRKLYIYVHRRKWQYVHSKHSLMWRTWTQFTQPYISAPWKYRKSCKYNTLFHFFPPLVYLGFSQ